VYRASIASEVGSVPNCPPRWLHPPAPGSRRRRISSKSRHRTNCCLSNPTNETLILPEFFPSCSGPFWSRHAVASHFVLAQNLRRAKRHWASGSACRSLRRLPFRYAKESPGAEKCHRILAGCESCRTIAPWQGRRLLKARKRLRPRFQRLPISCRGRSFRKTVDESL
jgi:hypothetical protein